ncbi:MAG: adenosylcobinamide-phosphate synthase CbiB [Gammaproteobacteria bacterium]
MTISFVILAALLVDFMLGDPRHFHPISGFGNMANWLEKKLNKQSTFTSGSNTKSRFIGVAAVIILIVPITLLLTYVNALFTNQSLHIVEILILFFALGCNSLRLHALWILNALETSDLGTARVKTSWIVSRDTSHLDPSELSKATIESILENGNDAIFATLFWFVIAGVPGVVIYRLSNTLDAMWGYKSTQYLHFGWAAARLDDVLNFIPAHLTAISYAITGKFFTAINCWIKQAYQWKSLNAGIVMSTGAGALALKLGGAAQYQGIESQRKTLGKGEQPKYNDIKRAINLVLRSLVLWLVIIFVLSYFEYI